VRGYFYTAVRNRALDVRKREQAERARWTDESSDVPAGMAHDTPGPEHEMYRQEVAARVNAALDTLAPRAREAALLRWRDGLSRPEIAAIMGVAVPTINNQLTSAARVMRALLADLRSER
jgi:RNA polymerase sigma-70 factor (ECF subfamily)